MMSAQRNQPHKVHRENQSYEVRGELRVRGRRYSILDQLGNQHRTRLLLDDPTTRQLRVALVLPHDSSTAQHIQVLRRLSRSDELPQILEYERKPDHTIIVLTWVKGIALSDYLQRVQSGRVVAPTVYESVRLVRGLAHAFNRLNKHAQIVHADLKPQNLILTRHPSRLVMIDFGSAWPIEQTLFRSEGDGLSPVYAAPELQQGTAALATLADQFSVTLILYQLLTGEVPYSGLGGQAGRPGYVDEFRDSLVPAHERSEQVRRLPRSTRQSLEKFLSTGLQLDPAKRYGSSSAWLDAIEHIHLDLKLSSKSRGRSITAWERFLNAITDRLFRGSDR
jgi:serine/threonine protein kinase